MSDGRGLYLQVNAKNGGKYWRYGYRHKGKQRTLTLGEYPLMSLAAARDAHADARRQLLSGIDPAAPEQQEQGGGTFADVFEAWLAHWRKVVSERHAGMVERMMRARVLPALGGLDVASITTLSIVLAVQTIDQDGKNEEISISCR